MRWAVLKERPPLPFSLTLVLALKMSAWDAPNIAAAPAVKFPMPPGLVMASTRSISAGVSASPASEDLHRHVGIPGENHPLAVGRGNPFFQNVGISPFPDTGVKEFGGIHRHFPQGGPCPVDGPNETAFGLNRRRWKRQEEFIDVGLPDMPPAILFVNRLEQIFDVYPAVFVRQEPEFIGPAPENVIEKPGQRF